jgi:hypothetical protein
MLAPRFFFALDLPVLLVPLCPALTEAKSGRKYLCTLRMSLPTPPGHALE